MLAELGGTFRRLEVNREGGHGVGVAIFEGCFFFFPAMSFLFAVQLSEGKQPSTLLTPPASVSFFAH